VARLGAVGGVYVRADLDLKVLQGSAIAGFEEVIEDLAALRLRIVIQETGRSPGAQRAKAIEDAAFALGVYDDGGRWRTGDRLREGCIHDQQQRGDGKAERPVEDSFLS
jgi:hypothetical protein